MIYSEIRVCPTFHMEADTMRLSGTRISHPG